MADSRRKSVVRGALLALTGVPIVLFAMRLDSRGTVPWFYDWPFLVAWLVLALVANHYRARLDLAEGEKPPHWADSAIVHELTRVPEPMSDDEVKAQLEALSRRPDQMAAIAESEALLRRHFEQRQNVAVSNVLRGVQRRPRNRIGNAVIVLLLAGAFGWVLYAGYFQ